MKPLITTLPLTEDQTLTACGLCHRISPTLPAGHAHLEETHPRRYALAKERQ